MTIDLHGLTHKEALLLVEDTVLELSLLGSFHLDVITGNSPKLQKKVIEEVCRKHNFSYFISSNNLGVITIEYLNI